jgi:uncharacterized protein YndB with AHSA1/START domain
MIDVSHEVNSVERAIGSRTLEAGEARTLTISRVYDTSPEDLWDACTNPERLPRWFLPVSGDLRPGGRYSLEGNASGTISRCEPPAELDATWEYGGQVSWVELRLVAEGEGRTRFVLEHIAHVDDEMWAQYGPGAVGIGWDQAFIGLALHVAGDPALPSGREAVQAWQLSDEGRRHTAAASERWAAASIAAGADAGEARAAAERVTAAYTAEPSA